MFPKLRFRFIGDRRYPLSSQSPRKPDLHGADTSFGLKTFVYNLLEHGFQEITTLFPPPNVLVRPQNTLPLLPTPSFPHSSKFEQKLTTSS